MNRQVFMVRVMAVYQLLLVSSEIIQEALGPDCFGDYVYQVCSECIPNGMAGLASEVLVYTSDWANLSCFAEIHGLKVCHIKHSMFFF